MTREEAIKYLEAFKLCTPYTMDAQGVFYRAVEVAIKALEQEPCEDAISRKTVLQMIEDIQDAGGFIGYNTYSEAFDQVDKLPSVTPTKRWIPCSEGLPNIHNRCERYYVTLKSGDVDIAMFTECNGEHWWNFNFDDVIAWQYLPKPYVLDTNVGKMEEMESEDGN